MIVTSCEVTIQMPARLSRTRPLLRVASHSKCHAQLRVCARSSLSRLDALSRKLHYLESLGPFSRRRQPRALGSLNGVVSSTSASNIYLKGTD